MRSFSCYMTGSRQRICPLDFRPGSYFIARIHVHSFAIAMEQPAIFHMIGGDGWDGSPAR